LVQNCELNSRLLPLVDVGRLPHGELEGEDAQGPHVHSRVIPYATLNDLWGHPAESADLRFAPLVLLCEHHRKAKICQFDFSLS